jgi:hypothetical protein
MVDDVVTDQEVVIDGMTHSLTSLKIFDHNGFAKE